MDIGDLRFKLLQLLRGLGIVVRGFRPQPPQLLVHPPRETLRVSFPKTPSALFYKHFRLLSAMLFTATIEPFQPERTASPWAVHVVEALADKAPWWDYARSADGCTWGCECGRFVEKVRAAGLRVARAGWCGHKDKE